MKNISEQGGVSVEQILQTIRGVINGDSKEKENTDILELTEIISDENIISAANKDNQAILDKDTNIANNENKSDLIADSSKEEFNMSSGTDKNSKDLERIKNSSVELNNNNDSSDLLTKSKKNILLSEETVAETSETLKNLVRTVSKPISDGLSFRSGTSLEDLTIEILKPYLKEWLDCNLPGIVKHIVEKEVQKLIPKDED